MSELVEKFENSADWRKGYNRGRDDARAEPTFGPRRFYLLHSETVAQRKGPDFCDGYRTGYDEARYG